ncbi:MAG: dTDP-4-dehydrorhamnose 3,5-epimerase family protein [Oxalobacter sp.]|nr:dTDP-4-dehydrorhamnose 3,5-epimerase family protein [Oxalobacter sp.]
MKLVKTAFDGALILEPVIYQDGRGYFFESWNQRVFEEAGLYYDRVQDNESKSIYGTVRGIHYQKPPHAQAKLIRVLQGTILDVIVDLRVGSSTYG